MIKKKITVGLLRNIENEYITVITNFNGQPFGYNKDKYEIVEENVFEVEEKGKTFEEELQEAYDNRCFWGILDVIKNRNHQFIKVFRSNYPKSFVDKKAKEIYGENLVGKKKNEN